MKRPDNPLPRLLRAAALTPRNEARPLAPLGLQDRVLAQWRSAAFVPEENGLAALLRKAAVAAVVIMFLVILSNRSELTTENRREYTIANSVVMSNLKP